MSAKRQTWILEKVPLGAMSTQKILSGGAAFACAGCQETGTLAIVRRLVLPGDRRADEIALEILACSCGAKAFAVAEQLQKPVANAASLKAQGAGRMGFRLPGAAVDLLAFLIARCPDPAEEYCPCPVHAALNRRDLRDRWNLLHSFAPVVGFALVPARSRAWPAAAQYAYAPLDWTRDGAGYAATVEGRAWRLDFAATPEAPPYELAIGGAIELEIETKPPFWRLPQAL